MGAKASYEARPWVKFYEPGVPADVEVPLKSLPQLFDEATSKYGNKPALIFYGKRVSFSMLRDHTDRLAAALADLGLKKGDKVALYLLNSPQFVISYFAALKLGCTVTPISPVYTSFEIKHQLENSEARALICQDILYDKVEKAGVKLQHVIVTNIGEYLPMLKKLFGRTNAFGEIAAGGARHIAGVHQYQDLLKKYPPNPPKVDIDPKTDIAVLPYTGGTTGNPKGVVLTHYNLVAAVTAGASVYKYQQGEEVFIAFLPFFHIFGQVVIMLNGLFQGHTLVLFTTPHTESILDAIERYQATVFLGVPTLYEYLKDHKDTNKVNWKRLKLLLCGADTLHETTVRDWEKRTQSKITEGYGLTECAAASHVNPISRPKVGSFGVPVPNMMAAVVDPDGTEFLPVGEIGELVLKGPSIMQGYWKNPEETRAAFLEVDGERWLRTGDLVRMDEEGYFHYYDRRKDLIKYRGYSVFAKDIEDVLYTHPQIKAAGVIGVPDPAEGSIIKAIVVLQPEARGKVTEEEIRKYCEERLAHYKVPKIVEFRGELPKTDVGKVSRRELREESLKEARN
ncbi:MAG TPA: AMP-binding protein [Burkholderiales bacterium]